MFPKGLSTEDSDLSQMVLLWVAGTFWRRSLEELRWWTACSWGGYWHLALPFPLFPFASSWLWDEQLSLPQSPILKYGLVTGTKAMGSQPLTEKLETKSQNKSSTLTNWLSMVFKNGFWGSNSDSSTFTTNTVTCWAICSVWFQEFCDSHGQLKTTPILSVCLTADIKSIPGIRSSVVRKDISLCSSW